MPRIAEFLRARSSREQVLLAALAALALGAVWYFAAVGPLLEQAGANKQRRDAEAALLQRLERVGSRMPALPAPRPRSDASLLLLVNGSIRNAGLSAFLQEAAADGETRVRLRLLNAPFPEVSVWLAALASQEGVRAVSADIERGAAPGITQVSLLLERSD